MLPSGRYVPSNIVYEEALMYCQIEIWCCGDASSLLRVDGEPYAETTLLCQYTCMVTKMTGHGYANCTYLFH